MKRLSNLIISLSIILALIALTLSFTIVLFIINRHVLFTQTSISSFLTLLVKSSYTFIGSTLSGFVAFLIFFLQDRKQRNERHRKEEQHLKKIETEHHNNLQILNKLLESFDSIDIAQLAELIMEPHSRTKELMKIYSIRMDFTFYEKLKDEVNEEILMNKISGWRQSYQIWKYLKALVNDIMDKENTKIVLDLIKRGIIELTK